MLSGQVPKRFAFDLKGRQLSCRIEKRDGGTGDLKVVLVAGEATSSVQQTNAPGGVIEVSYEGEVRHQATGIRNLPGRLFRRRLYAGSTCVTEFWTQPERPAGNNLKPVA